MAVANDYNLLVHTLNEAAAALAQLREDVEASLLREARDNLAVNETHWVNRIALQMMTIGPFVTNLGPGAQKVLRSRPGERVWDEDPPSAPDTL